MGITVTRYDHDRMLDILTSDFSADFHENIKPGFLEMYCQNIAYRTHRLIEPSDAVWRQLISGGTEWIIIATNEENKMLGYALGANVRSTHMFVAKGGLNRNVGDHILDFLRSHVNPKHPNPKIVLPVNPGLIDFRGTHVIVDGRFTLKELRAIVDLAEKELEKDDD